MYPQSQFMNQSASGNGGAQQQNFVYNNYTAGQMHGQLQYPANAYYANANNGFYQGQTFPNGTDMQFANRAAGGHPQFAAPVVALNQTAGHPFTFTNPAAYQNMRQQYPMNAQAVYGQYYHPTMMAQAQQQQYAIAAQQAQAALFHQQSTASSRPMASTPYQGVNPTSMGEVSQPIASGMYPNSYQTNATYVSNTSDVNLTSATSTAATASTDATPSEDDGNQATQPIAPVKKTKIVIKDAGTNEIVDLSAKKAVVESALPAKSITVQSPVHDKVKQTRSTNNSESTGHEENTIETVAPKDESNDKKNESDWSKKDWSNVPAFVPKARIENSDDRETEAEPEESTALFVNKQAEIVQNESQQAINSPTITTGLIKNGTGEITEEVPIYNFEVPSTVKVELTMGESSNDFKPDVVFSPSKEENPLATKSIVTNEERNESTEETPNDADAKKEIRRIEPTTDKSKIENAFQPVKSSKKKKGKKDLKVRGQNEGLLDAYKDEEPASEPTTPREADSKDDKENGLPEPSDREEAVKVPDEEDLSWDEKPIDEKPAEDEKVEDQTNNDDQQEETEFENKAKTYDREFLMSLQKNNASLKKGPFAQSRDLKEIVLNQPNFLQTLPDNQSDFRASDFQGADFTPGFMRKQGPPSIGKNMPFGNIPQRQRSYNNNPRPQDHKRFTTQQPSGVNIMPSANAWKPKSKQDTSKLNEEEKKTEEIKRKTTYILNRLTPQNFAQLSKEMALLEIDTEERVQDVITIIFNKACSEPNFAEAYANICRTVLQIRTKQPQNEKIDDDPVIRGFRRSLLTACQNEFQKEKDYDKTFADKKTEIESNFESTKDEATKKEKLQDLEIEMKKAKKKSLGNIRFIGELFKLNFLTEKIMHDCIVTLLKAKDEDSLECMCKLLYTIGEKLDERQGKALMDQYFARIKTMVENRQTSSRIRFMLQDVLELRDSNYQSKKDNNPKTIDQIHKDAHREDVQISVAAAQLKMNNRNSYNDQRKFSVPQRNPNPQSQNEWVNTTVPHSSRNVNISSSEVKSILSKTAGATKFGTTEMKFGGSSQKSNWSKGSGAGGSISRNSGAAGGGAASPNDSPANRFQALQSYGDEAMPSEPRASSLDHRFNSGRGPSAQQRQQSKDEILRAVRQNSSGARDGARDSSRDSQRSTGGGGGGRGSDRGARRFTTDRGHSEIAVPKPLTEEQLSNKVNMVISELMDSGDVKEYCEVVQQEVPVVSHEAFIKTCIEYAIDKKEDLCSETGRLLYELVRSGIVSKKAFASGLSDTLANAVDLACDIPKIWYNYGILVAPLVKDQVAFDRFPEITKCIIEDDKAKEFMAEIVLRAAKDLGENTVNDMWKLTQMSWKMFCASYNTDQDIEDFIKDKNLTFTQASRTNDTITLESAENSLYDFMADLSKSNAEIFDWISNHLQAFIATNPFIHMLTRNVCKACVNFDVSPYKFENNVMEKRKDILMKYIDNNEQLMFEALFSIQLLLVDLAHPQGLLTTLFKSLYELDIITEQAFYAWESNQDPQYQRGKGVCSANCKAFLSYLREATEATDSD